MLAVGCAVADEAGTGVVAASLARTPAVETSADGIVVAWGGDYLKLQVRADNIIRVAYAKNRAFFERASIDVLPSGAIPRWTLAMAGDAADASGFGHGGGDLPGCGGAVGVGGEDRRAQSRTGDGDG
jgi:hypothetical protein